jgi:hypothetical protein
MYLYPLPLTKLPELASRPAVLEKNQSFRERAQHACFHPIPWDYCEPVSRPPYGHLTVCLSKQGLRKYRSQGEESKEATMLKRTTISSFFWLTLPVIRLCQNL